MDVLIYNLNGKVPPQGEKIKKRILLAIQIQLITFISSLKNYSPYDFYFCKNKELCYNLTSQTIIMLSVGNQTITLIKESKK